MMGIGCGCGEDHITGVVCVYVGVSCPCHVMVMGVKGGCAYECVCLSVT